MKIRCKKCGDIVEGDGKGYCVSCKCGNCYIDSTKYYCRIGGNFENIEVFINDGLVINFDEYVKSQETIREEHEKDIITI